MTEKLEAAAKAFRRAESRANEARAQLMKAITEAADSGVPQVEIVRITGYTRERIRQIVAKAKGGDL